jgi:hypothetical protein
MHMNRHLGVGLGLLLGLGTACPGDDSSDTGNQDSGNETGTTQTTQTEETGTEETGTGPMECVGTGGPNAVGEACASNSECNSGLCLIYTDSPLNDDAVCAETPEGCNTRVTGTVFDFSDREPVSGETVRVVAALDAITNPAGATALMEGTTDGQGRIDLTSASPLSAAIAILAIAGGGDSYLTVTGLASPIDGSYPPGVGNHDMWVVPAATLTQWSEDLADDPGIPENALPLGERGGIVGLVRDSTTGEPIQGATVAPTADSSNAVVRYLDDTGGFNEDVTGASGIFVIFGAPTTGETFAATVDGQQIASTQAGSANNVIFTLILRGTAP